MSEDVNEEGLLAYHVVLGLTEDAYERLLVQGRSTPGWRGLEASLEPRWHSHPALGITGHAHGPTVQDARTPHVHRRVLAWDHVPLPIPDDDDDPNSDEV